MVYSDAEVQAEYSAPTPSSGKTWIVVVMVIAVTALIFGLLLLVYNANRIYGGNSPTTSTPPTPTCDSQTAGLPVPPTSCCVPLTGGDSAQSRYLESAQLIIDPAAPLPYSQVCRQFCAPGSSYNSQNDTCSLYLNNDPTSFNNCITLLKPVGCTGASKPVAKASDGTLFYGQKYSPTGCKTKACPS